MARTLNPAQHTVRREAFIDAAEHLLLTKGYDQMSVQDVLDASDASKGAFYHYFDSKRALLQAIVDRMTERVLGELEPCMTDPALPAPRKFERLALGAQQWKTEHKDLVQSVLDIWMSDDNAVVREHLRHSAAQRLLPLLAAIVAQGTREGTFQAGPSDGVARVLLAILQGSQDTGYELYLACRGGAATIDTVSRTLAAYVDAYERVLGLPSGSLHIVDEASLHAWFQS
jgi:AcrR family transcriptional regulator